jgi:hypothetical protein
LWGRYDHGKALTVSIIGFFSRFETKLRMSVKPSESPEIPASKDRSLAIDGLLIPFFLNGLT